MGTRTKWTRGKKLKEGEKKEERGQKCGERHTRDVLPKKMLQNSLVGERSTY